MTADSHDRKRGRMTRRMTMWRRRGSVSIIIAVLALPAIGAVGLAVDLARAFVVKSRLVTAIDAAALAGARAISSTSIQTEAASWFWANFNRTRSDSNVGYMGTLVSGPVITVNTATGEVQIRVNASVPTVFMRVFGRDVMEIMVENTARRVDQGMELALVLDTTGSMGASNMAALRTAATDLVNILYGTRETVTNLWVSVVPYTASVNVGPSRTGWLNAGSLNQNDYQNTAWAGCVEARHLNGDDENDNPPAVAPFRPLLWRSTSGVYAVRGDNDWTRTNITEARQSSLPDNTAVGPNLGCPRPVMLVRVQSLSPRTA